MDRLTQRYEYGVCDCLRKCDDGKSDCCGQKCFQSIIDKLAAYEDNGQTPEEQAKMIAYVGNDMESNALLLAEAHNLRAELELVKAERNAALKGIKNSDCTDHYGTQGALEGGAKRGG